MLLVASPSIPVSYHPYNRVLCMDVWMYGCRRTVANQQTRTSYLCSGFKPSSRNHDSVPSAPDSAPARASASGNEALSLVRKSGFGGEMRSRPMSSRGDIDDDDEEEGKEGANGARKMVFSVLAVVREMKVRRVR